MNYHRFKTECENLAKISEANSNFKWDIIQPSNPILVTIMFKSLYWPRYSVPESKFGK